MKRFYLLMSISFILTLSLFCSACGKQIADEHTDPSSDSLTFSVALPSNAQSTFRIETKEGDYRFDQTANTYTLLSGGTYDCYGDLYEGQIIVSANEDAEIILNLNGSTITNSLETPVSILTAAKVEISSKKDTENKIYDLRDRAVKDDAEGGAIYAECDLTLKGNGMLEVISNYNNGIHSKDDLKIKNLTLTVKAVNNALKGNDSVTIESGAISAVSSGGDAVKTVSTDLNKNGEQRGAVTITGGTICLYAACDGIDAASDITIADDAKLEIYTDSYSTYSSDCMTSSESVIYLRLNDAEYNENYKYSAYFYNADNSGTWKDVTFFQEVTASKFPGEKGQKGEMDRNIDGASGHNKNGMIDHDNGANFDRDNGANFDRDNGADFDRSNGADFLGRTWDSTYYYYSVNVPAGYTNVKFYAYLDSQEQGQDQDYIAVSDTDTTISASWDTYVVSSITDKIILSSGWTNYQSMQGNTGLDYSCKGMKAGNTINITGGSITIQSRDDSLHADFDEIMESTGQNGLGNITISGGTLTITSDDDGIHADQDLVINNGTINVINSYEALEANRIYILDGAITAYAKDDGFNANSKGAYSASIEINGGKIDLTVPGGDTDTMDSNGTILVKDGFIFLKNGQMNGNSRGGGTIDTNRGITVLGGTVIAIGCIGNTIEGSVMSTSESFTAGKYEIWDNTGEKLAEFELSSSYNAYMFWSEAFLSGQTYTIFRDGTKIGSFTK